MKRAFLGLALALLPLKASADEVSITCKASQEQRLVEGVLMAGKPVEPWNFTIQADSLHTPWPAPCAVMEGRVDIDRVMVECGSDALPVRFKRIIEIDRRLGTFREQIELAAGRGRNAFLRSGICEKRQAF